MTSSGSGSLLSERWGAVLPELDKNEVQCLQHLRDYEVITSSPLLFLSSFSPLLSSPLLSRTPYPPSASRVLGL